MTHRPDDPGYQLVTRTGWPPRGRTPRPYPVAALARAIGLDPADTHGLTLALGIDRSWVKRYRHHGLTDAQADTWACRAGLHPADVWPRWGDELHGVALLNANRATCPAGHPYDTIDARGWRACTTCRANRRRNHVNTQATTLATTHSAPMRQSAPHLSLIIPGVPERDVLSPPEVADWLRVPVDTLRVWRQRGTGPAFVRVGRHVRYLRTDLDAYLAVQRVDPAAVAGA